MTTEELERLEILCAVLAEAKTIAGEPVIEHAGEVAAIDINIPITIRASMSARTYEKFAISVIQKAEREGKRRVLDLLKELTSLTLRMISKHKAAQEVLAAFETQQEEQNGRGNKQAAIYQGAASGPHH